MKCARCGGTLETYALEDSESHVCVDCGFVDTAFEHEVPSRPEPEPWATALKRFHEQYFEGEIAITGSGETAALVKVDTVEDDDTEPAAEAADEPAGEVNEEEPGTEPADDPAGDADEEGSAVDAEEDVESEESAETADEVPEEKPA